MMQILQVLARGDSRREWGGFSPSSLPQLVQRLMALSRGGHRKLDKQSGKRRPFPSVCVNGHLCRVGHPHCTIYFIAFRNELKHFV